MKNKETAVFECKLCSANRWGKGADRALYQSCKVELTKRLAEQFKVRGLKSCAVSVWVSKKKWKGDLDNAIKIIIDALQGAGVVLNDNGVHPLRLDRTENEVSKVDIRW